MKKSLFPVIVIFVLLFSVSDIGVAGEEDIFLKETVVNASDFIFDNYDDSPEQQAFGYPAHQSLLNGEINLDSLIIGPGREGNMGSVINFQTPSYYDIPINTKKLIWEMNITPRTQMLSGSYTSTGGTSTFILQRFIFKRDEPFESSMCEISHVTGYPIQIEQGIIPHPFGGNIQEPFVTNHGNWACGNLAVYPKIIDNLTTGCTNTITHPLGKASPFDDWNSANPSETHRFKLEIDYEEWVVRAYIDNKLVGETGIMSSNPYEVLFYLSSRAAPNRDFHRIYSDINIYILTEKESERLSGDVNGDCIVNIFDLAAVGLAFNSRQGDSNWNPNVDLTGNGIVNIFDLARVGLNYGRRC